MGPTGSYWKQKATPWVSAAVLIGGLVSASILFLVVRVESHVDVTSTSDLVEEWEY